MNYKQAGRFGWLRRALGVGVLGAAALTMTLFAAQPAHADHNGRFYGGFSFGFPAPPPVYGGFTYYSYPSYYYPPPAYYGGYPRFYGGYHYGGGYHGGYGKHHGGYGKHGRNHYNCHH